MRIDGRLMLEDITPVILTFNEESNIANCLSRLTWAKDVVIVDSFSKDRTLEIAETFSNARIIQRSFDQHATQWNFATNDTAINTDWVLCLDADYNVSTNLQTELAGLAPEANVDGFIAKFNYCVYGHQLRGSLYPEHVVLFRQSKGSFRQSGHTQRLEIFGSLDRLSNPIDHDDRKPLSQWISSQQRYAALEVSYALNLPLAQRRFVDKIRLTGWLSPFAVLLYALFVKACILDGRAGWFYTLQRVIFEAMFCLELHRRKLDGTESN